MLIYIVVPLPGPALTVYVIAAAVAGLSVQFRGSVIHLPGETVSHKAAAIQVLPLNTATQLTELTFELSQYIVTVKTNFELAEFGVTVSVAICVPDVIVGNAVLDNAVDVLLEGMATAIT